MSFLDSFKSWFWERTITPSQLFSTGQDGWFDLEAASGVAVTVEKAMQSAIGACVRLLADDIATLPIDAYRKVGEDSVPIPIPDWLERPSGRLWDTSTNLISDFVVSLGTDGNTFLLTTPNVANIQRVEVLDPAKTDIREEGGRVTFKMDGGGEAGEERIVHVPWVRLPGELRGINIVQASKDSSGLELAAREWAGAFFRNGATLGGNIRFPVGSPKPSKEEQDELRKAFAKRHEGRRRSHVFGILYGGAEYDPTTLKPQEAELGPLWRHVVEEAARIYHIPPHLLGSQESGAAAFASVEQRSIEYVVHGVRGYVVRIERALSRLLPGDDTFVRINVNGLLRGDFKTRVEAYGVLLDKKVVKRSEVRALEDMRPDPEADAWLETPNNNEKEPAAAPERSITINDAPVTVAPELRIDSVLVSDAGVERIAEASTSGIAAGIAVVADEVAAGDARIGASLEQERTERVRLAELVEARLSEARAEIATLRDDIAAAAEREAARNQPVEFFIEKDAQGRTTHITEKRGASVVKKRVTRDDTGAVLSITAA